MNNYFNNHLPPANYNPIANPALQDYHLFNLELENKGLKGQIKHLIQRLQNKLEMSETLVEDHHLCCLNIMGTNIEGASTICRFASFIIEDIYIINFPELANLDNAIIITLKCDSGQKKYSLFFQLKDLEDSKLIKMIRLSGGSFVTKRPDKRKSELLIDYISQKINKAGILKIPYWAGWFNTGNKLEFLDSSSNLLSIIPDNLIHHLPIVHRRLLTSDPMPNDQMIIFSYFKRKSILKSDTSILFILYYHLALLQELFDNAEIWRMEKFIYVQLTDSFINCSKLMQVYLQLFSSNDLKYLTLNTSTNDIMKRLCQIQDEVLMLKLDSESCSSYAQTVRIKNWNKLVSIYTQGILSQNDNYERSLRAPLACFSNHNICDLNMENALCIYLSNDDINLTALQQELRNPETMGNYTQLFCSYISKNYSILREILPSIADNAIQIGSETFEYLGIPYGIFKTVYAVIQRFITQYNLDIKDYLGSESEIDEVLLEFLLQNETASDSDYICDSFIDGFRHILTSCQLIDRKTGKEINSNVSKFKIFIDEKMLYISEPDLKTYVIPDIYSFYISAPQLLSRLSEAEILISDKSVTKTYLKTVYFPYSKAESRKKMIAIDKSKLYRLGDSLNEY